MMKVIGAAYKDLKAERIRNLNSISADSNLLKTGKIPTIKELVEGLDGCTTWDQLQESISILREVRYLGSPKRKEISAALLNSLARIYESEADCEGRDENLVKCLSEIVSHDQMNPLILSDETAGETGEELVDGSDSYRTVLYTALDISSR